MKKQFTRLFSLVTVLLLLLALFAPVTFAEDTGTGSDTIPVAQFVADNHVLMTRADGRFIGWGDNSFGQLGLGEDAAGSYTTPVEITYFADKGKIKQIAAIKDTSFVLMNSGELYSTGSGTYGKHGQGDTYNKLVWGRVGGTLKFKRLYTNSAAEFCVAEDFSGSLYAWGKNSDGQLGVGDTNARTSPTLVKENASVKNLWLGETYVEYVDLDGNMYYWGTNAKGQMGLSSTYTKTTHKQTRYSTGERENVTSSGSVTVLNPTDALVPTLFNLISEDEILDMSTPEPEPPAVGQANYTLLKYNINPKQYEAVPNNDYEVSRLNPWKTATSISGTYQNWTHTWSNFPNILVSTTGTTAIGEYLYIGTGTDAGTTFTYRSTKSYTNETAVPVDVYYPITQAAVYTTAAWYTGVTKTVGPSTSSTNYLFRDAYTGQLIVDQTAPQTIYFFKISLPTQYNQMPATQYSIGVSKNTYDLIMANQGASMEQEWYDYTWNNRTLFDTETATIKVLAGANHALALVGGKLYGWGDVSKKQLADIAQSTYPTELTAANTLITQQKAAGINLTGVKTDRNSNYLTFDDGSIWTWGDNSFNKSGVDGAPVNIAAPTKVAALQDKKIINIVPGRDTNYYITENGEIYVSGSNVGGVSGLGEDYKDEASISSPTKIGNVGFSDTIDPPSSPEISVPVEVVEEEEIDVTWDIVPNASKYVLKRTVTLKSEDSTENVDATADMPMATSLLYVPKNKLASFATATGNSTPQLIYDGERTIFKDVAKPEWASAKYELKAVNSIGDYSSAVESNPVTVLAKSNNGGGDTGGGDDDTPGGDDDIHNPTPPTTGGDTNITINPSDSNVTVNPPSMPNIKMPDIIMPNQNQAAQSNNPAAGGYIGGTQPFAIYQFFGSEYAGLQQPAQQQLPQQPAQPTAPVTEEAAPADTAVAASTVTAPNTGIIVAVTIAIFLAVIALAISVILFFIAKHYMKVYMLNNSTSNDQEDFHDSNF